MPDRRMLRFPRLSSIRRSKRKLTNMKTRKTVPLRLALITLLLVEVSLVGFTVHASQEAAAAAAAANKTVITPDIYTLPQDVLVNVTRPMIDGNSGGNYFVKSQGNPPYFKVVEFDEASKRNVTKGYVYDTTDIAPGSSYGYSGPISLLVSIDPQGVVLSVRLLWAIESRPLNALDPPFLSTLVGKSVLGNYSVGKDVDGVSGATYTSYGIVSGIREAGRAVLNDVTISSKPPPPPPSLKEKLMTAIANLTTPTDYLQSLILLALIGVSIVGITRKIELLRYGVLLSSLLLVEYMGTRMIGIDAILNLKNLTLPPLHGNLYWYLLFGSAFSLSFVWGRFYCGWLCPFGAATEFLNMIANATLKLRSRIPKSVKVRASLANGALRKQLSRFLPIGVRAYVFVNSNVSFAESLLRKKLNLIPRFNLKIPLPGPVKHSASLVGSFLSKRLGRFRPSEQAVRSFVEGNVNYFLLTIVAVVAVTKGDMTLTNVEPFTTFFLDQGTTWMWLLLFAVLAASIAVNRPFCRYLCPTGAFLSLPARMRVKEISRWPDCSTCRLCERDCPTGAIQGARMSSADCLNCGDCERNYENTQGCPHWLRLRSLSASV